MFNEDIFTLRKALIIDEEVDDDAEALKEAMEKSIEKSIKQYTDTFNSQQDLNLEWLESEEYRRYQKYKNILIIPLVIILLCSISMGIYLFITTPLQRTVWEAVPFVITTLIAITASLIIQVNVKKNNLKEVVEAKYWRKQRFVQDNRDDKVVESSRDGVIDLATLWKATQSRIGNYHDQATAQSAKSFRFGQTFTVFGFFVVLAIGAAAAFAPAGSAPIAASVVGVAGAAMTAYISKTFMKTQQETSAQFRQFFSEPVETSRLLNLERLIQTLDEQDRPAAVREVIHTMMLGPGLHDHLPSPSKSD